MGVVYKLKKEVIDFIIARKKTDPSVSCRKLVDIIKNDFSLEVSKSSVNAVIKEFQLSSPVGRRPLAKAPKNFFIPQNKKALLLEQVAPFLADVKSPSGSALQQEAAPQESAPERLPAPLPVLELSPRRVSEENGQVPELTEEPGEKTQQQENKELLPTEFAQEQEGDADGAESTVHLLPDPLERVSVSEERRVEIELSRVLPASQDQHDRFWNEDKGFLYENLGLLLPGVLLWDRQRRPSLGEILAGAMKEPVAADQLAGLELLWLYRLLIEEEPANFSEGGAFLLGCFGFSDRGSQELLSQMDALTQNKRTIWEIQSLMETTGARVSLIRITMKNGTKFFMDPLFDSYATDFCGSVHNTVPLLSAVDRVGDILITNSRPLVLGALPFALSDERTQAFWKLFDGAEDIEEVALLDESGKSCWEFREIPRMPREFVVGAHMMPGDLQRLDADMIGNSQPYFDPFDEVVSACWEGRFPESFLGASLRAIVLGTQERAQNLVLLSNMLRKSRDVVFEYSYAGKSLSNEKTDCFVGEDHRKTIKNEYPDPQNDLLGQVKGCLMAELLPLLSAAGIDAGTTMVQLFWKTRGYYKATRRGIFVRFCPAGEKAFLACWPRLVAAFNRRDIFSYDGRRVHFSVEGL